MILLGTLEENRRGHQLDGAQSKTQDVLRG